MGEELGNCHVEKAHGHPNFTETASSKLSPSHGHTHNSRMGLSAQVYCELMLPAVKAPGVAPSAGNTAECHDFMADPDFFFVL